MLYSLGLHVLTQIVTQCKECEREPVGDYFENKDFALCPDCYKQLQESTPISKEDSLQRFYKVRDCRTVHKHEFLGKDSKIIVS